MYRLLMTYKILILMALSLSVHAEFSYLGRSPEGLLMGDAYTAVADDENTLFYNPAALGRHQGVTIVPLNPTIGVTDVLDKNLSLGEFELGLDSRFKNFPKEPEAIADRILGIPLYLQLGASPVIKMQHFGINFFANSKTSMQLENAIHPTLDVDYRLDRGVTLGYAFTMGKGKKGTSGSQTSLGVGLKTMNRQGLDGKFDLTGTQLLTIVENSDSYKTIRRNLGYSKGSGVGFDIGAEQTFYMGNSMLNFGTSLLDIGDTSFSKSEGIGEIPDQDMSLNFGTAYSQDFKIFDYTLAMDYSNAIDASTAAMSKLKLGARARFPFVNVYWGWNAGYISWGLGLDIFLFKINVGFYGVELGPAYKQKEGKRAVFSINLLNIELDSL